MDIRLIFLNIYNLMLWNCFRISRVAKVALMQKFEERNAKIQTNVLTKTVDSRSQ
jgi:hypothetical protein